MRRILFVTAVLTAFSAGLFITAAPAQAGQLFTSLSKAKPHTERNDFKGGVSIGTTGTLLTHIRRVQVDNLDLSAAGAGVQSVVTTTGVTGVALGDNCQVAPLQDDAAWDEGNLNCFVESAGTIKLQYHSDSTGGDPAATNDYIFTLTR